MEDKRSFMKKSDAFILFLVLVLCGGFLVYRYFQKQSKGTGENIAMVTLGNTDIMQLDLGLYHGEPQEINLKEKYDVPVSLRLENGTIRFVNVTCPDHICEQYGTMSLDMDMAVCLPNQVSVVIYTPEDIAESK